MVAPRQLTTTDWLAEMPNDTEEAPWMVMPDFQFWAIHLLVSILRRFRAEQGLPWYIGAELMVVLPRPGMANLEVAPDLFVVEADDHRRGSWNVRDERQPPRFVLEIVTGASWARDTEEKPHIYDFLGVEEYAIFAPLREDGGPKLFGYHRGPFGPWQPWPSVRGALRSVALGGLALIVSAENSMFLRLRDRSGRLLPSDEEAAELAIRLARTETQRATDATQRAADAARRAETEAQRAQAAEARVAALEAELVRLREGR